MQDYLDRFGHRAVFEMELASTRWAEDPGYVLEQVRFHVDNPPARDNRSRAAEVRRRAERELAAVPAVLRPAGAADTGPRQIRRRAAGENAQVGVGGGPPDAHPAALPRSGTAHAGNRPISAARTTSFT